MSRRLVTVARYDIPPKAHMAINALEDAGIRCVIQDEQLVAMDYLLNLAVGGIKVQVWEEDAERAAAILGSIERGPGAAAGEDDEPEADHSGDAAISQEPTRPAIAVADTDDPLTDNTRDRYARRAALSALFSILVAPVAWYTAYLLLMTAFTEGRLSGDRWLGVLVAVILTPVAMLLSPVWLLMVCNSLGE